MRIIKGFKDKEEWIKVLEKLIEYEGIGFNGYKTDKELGFNWYNDSKFLFIDDQSLTHSSNLKDSFKYKEAKIIYAKDYLHPIKVGDRVEIQDDTDMNGFIYIVKVDLGNGLFNLEDENSEFIRHEDCLQVLKEHNILYKPGDTIRVKTVSELEEDCPNKYLNEDLVNELGSNIYKIDSYYCGDKTRYSIGKSYVLDEWMIDSKCEQSVTVDDEYSSLSLLKGTIGITGTDTISTLGEDNIKDIVSTVIAENTAKELDKEILNINNKTMNNIETEMNAIANEEYFDNKKNIKAIAKADKEMKDMIDILNDAAEDIGKKYSRLNSIRRNFNNNYVGKDSISLKNMLSNHKEVIEFIDHYINNSVNELGNEEIKEEKFDVESMFN